MGSLLWAGIGDTIRVSLSAEPEQEVKVGYEMLKSLGLEAKGYMTYEDFKRIFNNFNDL